MNVKKLLDGHITEQYNDKLFWYASKVIIKDKTVKVYIDNQNLVTFDDVNINVKKISEFTNNKQKNLEYMKSILISSGSFLFINDKLAVTQRELTTTFDPGFWTTPAGRCDRTILETGIKETLEEIEIKRDNTTLFPDIAKQFISNQYNVEFYNTSFENPNLLLKTYDVALYLDNILIEECKSWMYVSEKVNTIEFRIPIFVELNEDDLTFKNPEFGTDAGLKSIEELQKLDLVPALKHLIKEIDNG